MCVHQAVVICSTGSWRVRATQHKIPSCCGSPEDQVPLSILLTSAAKNGDEWGTGDCPAGCSSIFALLTENGPFRVTDDAYTLQTNPQSWNKVRP